MLEVRDLLTTGAGPEIPRKSGGTTATGRSPDRCPGVTPSPPRQPPEPGRLPYGAVRLPFPVAAAPPVPPRPTSSDTRGWDGRRITLPLLSIGALRRRRCS
ncbi:hypothetical protein GCM10010361_00320 [Streptomyces olivaceiscleroticus]|uniref:Uncharacterized protein n=1 Tax=Streptomyces olivaceiscleroticus TaxID=68245 RepID=A0ABN0ZAM2_9ACTN